MLFLYYTICLQKVWAEEDEQVLQNDLGKMARWEDQSIMCFHSDTCPVLNVMYTKAGPNLSGNIYHLYEHKVDRATYLGSPVHVMPRRTCTPTT